jgi:hypothetical protein
LKHTLEIIASNARSSKFPQKSRLITYANKKDKEYLVEFFD